MAATKHYPIRKAKKVHVCTCGYFSFNKKRLVAHMKTHDSRFDIMRKEKKIGVVS